MNVTFDQLKAMARRAAGQHGPAEGGPPAPAVVYLVGRKIATKGIRRS